MPGITRGRSLADGPTIGRPGDDASLTAAPAPPPRQLARDKRNGRTGEIMPHPIPEQLRDPTRPSSRMLRPVGGGREWAVPQDCIELINPAVAS